jgi:hypothetical protein
MFPTIDVIPYAGGFNPYAASRDSAEVIAESRRAAARFGDFRLQTSFFDPVAASQSSLGGLTPEQYGTFAYYMGGGHQFDAGNFPVGGQIASFTGIENKAMYEERIALARAIDKGRGAVPWGTINAMGESFVGLGPRRISPEEVERLAGINVGWKYVEREGMYGAQPRPFEVASSNYLPGGYFSAELAELYNENPQAAMTQGFDPQGYKRFTDLQEFRRSNMPQATFFDPLATSGQSMGGLTKEEYDLWSYYTGGGYRPDFSDAKTSAAFMWQNDGPWVPRWFDTTTSYGTTDRPWGDQAARFNPFNFELFKSC